MTELDWTTDKKHFTITVWDDVDTKHKGTEYDRKCLVNLANSILQYCPGATAHLFDKIAQRVVSDARRIHVDCLRDP
jgi:hypothetical protein